MKKKIKKETPRALKILSVLYWVFGGISLLYWVFGDIDISLIDLLYGGFEGINISPLWGILSPLSPVFLGIVMVLIGVALWKKWTYTRTTVIVFLPISLLLGLGCFLLPAIMLGFGATGSAWEVFFINSLGQILILEYIGINFLNIITLIYLVANKPPKRILAKQRS